MRETCPKEYKYVNRKDRRLVVEMQGEDRCASASQRPRQEFVLREGTCGWARPGGL